MYQDTSLFGGSLKKPVDQLFQARASRASTSSPDMSGPLFIAMRASNISRHWLQSGASPPATCHSGNAQRADEAKLASIVPIIYAVHGDCCTIGRGRRGRGATSANRSIITA
jgi:hypothetical protein